MSNKQEVIKMLLEKERKCLEVAASGHQAPLVLTPHEANQIMKALAQPDVIKIRRQQELLRELAQQHELVRELTQIISEQV